MDQHEAIIKVFYLSAISFIVAMAITPFFTNFLYRHKIGKQIRADGDTPVFTKLHEKKRGTPTMGGILIWFTTLLLALSFWFFDRVLGLELFHKLNFLTRQQTLLPLGALVASALLGMADDWFGIKGIGTKGGGIRMRYKLLLYALIALVGAYWFYYKLGFDVIGIPGLGYFSIGAWYIPLFIFVVIATSFSVNETDGLDGLAGGVLAVAFFSLGLIAFLQGRYELASMAAVIGGALLAFLWFNIYPARFFMGDTGSMSLGTVLAIMAFLTNSVAVLPLIGFVLVLESGSVIIQVVSRKLFKKKVFLSAPLHHHFEAIGWPETKVTMRFWVVASVMAAIGVALSLMV
jgi:phospho-N-acetylmuramoyl-pentapeptide-transferase